MAKQSNILRRSKRAENRVQRYLWPGSDRAWKERWDVGIQHEDGDWLWVGEVKSRNTKSLAEAYSWLKKALDQVWRVAPPDALPFAVLVKPGAPVSKGLVMWAEPHALSIVATAQALQTFSIPAITRIDEFRKVIHGLEASEVEA